jgi:hypothetical protein
MANTKGTPKTAGRAASPADPAELREAGAVVNPGTAETSARKRAASPARPRAAGPTTPKRGKAEKGESYAESAARRNAGKETDRLRDDLREFASARPSGWGHDDWLAFLDTLKERGHDTSDAEGIGRQLERERLATVLSSVPGLGPKRVEALVERFETLWSARHAGVEEVASVPGIPRALAERVAEALRER